MMRGVRSTLVRGSFVSLVLAAAACDCGSGTGTSLGRLEARPTTVDFGKVRVGDTKRREILVTNTGTGDLTVSEVVRDGVPDSVTVSGVPDVLTAAQSATVTLVWAPDAEATLDGTLTFKTDSRDVPTIEVAVKGAAVVSKLVVTPNPVDFGVVEVGHSLSIDVDVKNDGAIDETVVISPDNDDADFTVEYPQGDTLSLSPGDSGRFTITYAPALPTSIPDLAHVQLVPCEGCAGVQVEARGEAVESFVDVQPRDCVEFGLVPPGDTGTKQVTVTNHGGRTLAVNSADFPANSGFSRTAALPASLGRDETTTVTLTFTPTELRRYESTLRITTDDASKPTVDVCVRGSGGGPDIQVGPPSLDFGLSAVNIAKTRTVVVSNIGLGTSPGSDLHVSAVTVDGTNEFTHDAPASFTLAPGATRAVHVSYTGTAEGSDAAALVFASDDLDASSLRVPLAAQARNLPPCQLQVIPAAGTLDFGNVTHGRESTLTIRLGNAGSADCLLTDLDLAATSSTAFRLVNGPIATQVIAAGAAVTVPVTFTPGRSGAYTGTVRFAISDPVHPAREIALTGLSEPGCLFIAPNELDFGNVGAGCNTRERAVTVYNTCQTPISVTSVALADADGQPFVVAGLPTFPASLASGALSVRVRFSPQANGTYAGALLVGSSERAEPYNVGLYGRASDDARNTDSFDQRARPSADVLFVVDNSGSMGDEQEALAANFGSFMQYALSLDFDFHLAAITTDTAENGAFRESAAGIRVITPETPFPAENFADIVNPGTDGSGDEQGFATMAMCLSPPTIDNENVGFLRDEAFLTVIFISDEEDGSPESVAFYEDFLLNVKGARAANTVSANAIAIPDSRYKALVDHFGGTWVDIGQPSWTTALNSLGTSAFSFRTRFFLTSTPADPTQIEVRINGDLIPRMQGTITQWRYDATQNAVIFDPLAIPEPGDVLDVSYPVACLR